MFNRGPFNRSLFNRPFTVEIFLSAKLDGQGSMTAALNLDFNMAARLDGQGELIAAFIREIMLAAQMDGFGSLSANMIRERLLSAKLDGEGGLGAILSRYHVDEIEITDSFAPGDKVIIDSGKFRVLKNGQMIGYNGDFFDLHSGENKITYTDPATGRTIQIRVTYRDKYLY